MKVKVIGFEDGKISLSSKALKPDPRSLIPDMFRLGDIIEGEVVRYVPYGVFIRVYEDINGLVHLSEITQAGTPQLKIGTIVKAKIILLEPQNRKIGLSIRAINADGSDNPEYVEKKQWKPKPKKEYIPRPQLTTEAKVETAEVKEETTL
jgi:small subunit ribosomal protein S1